MFSSSSSGAYPRPYRTDEAFLEVVCVFAALYADEYCEICVSGLRVLMVVCRLRLTDYYLVALDCYSCRVILV